MKQASQAWMPVEDMERAETTAEKIPNGKLKKICLNIGGKKFVTYPSTLQTVPGTLLSDLSTDSPYYDPDNEEYFFDRNSRLFPYILDAYRTGQMHFPRCACAMSIWNELEFWGLTDEKIATCCWKTFCDWEEEQSTLAVLTDAYSGPLAKVNAMPNRGRWRSRSLALWLFLEDPHSSWMAKIWSTIYICVLIVSIIVVSMETESVFRIPAQQNLTSIMGESWNTTNPKIRMYYTTVSHPALRAFRQFSSCFFFFELFIRFIVCPNKVQFFLSIFNIIDIFAVVPVAIYSIINVCSPFFWLTHHIEIAYNVVGISSIFRTIRILKLVKHNRGLRVIFLAIKASLRELLLLVLLIIMGMLIFSACVYYSELYVPNTFESIPIGFWWSIVTMTTVGYGDLVPSTPAGYVIGSLCALTGILITGLPIPVIANNFSLFYTYARLKSKLDQRAAANTEKKLV